MIVLTVYNLNREAGEKKFIKRAFNKDDILSVSEPVWELDMSNLAKQGNHLNDYLCSVRVQVLTKYSFGVPFVQIETLYVKETFEEIIAQLNK